jgi:predicted Zn-dependent peptidase
MERSRLMRFLSCASLLAVLSTVATSCRSASVRLAAESPQPAITYHRLENGLRVVLARDTMAPLARVGMYFDVGSRDEPRGRAGFAHLFEHYMFEGSEQLAAGEFFTLVTSNGGRFGARTLYDLTKYTTIVPGNALDLMLWAEADRLRGLRFSQERFDAVRATVTSEVRQQAFDRPYGRFVWIDLPELAQTRWENSHSIYGDSAGAMHALDSASLADVRAFFAAYYTPDNAVLVIEGDIHPDVVLATVRERFGAIPRGPERSSPDLSEPRQATERRATVIDRNAPRPALAIGYHSPPRQSKDFWPMLVITHLLLEGRDSWMYEGVTQKNLTDWVYGGISARHGSIYTTSGPNFWSAYAYHDASVSPDSLLAAMDVVIDRLLREPVDDATLRRAISKARADYFGQWSQGFGEGKLDMLGQFALFDDAPQRTFTFDAELAAISAADVHRAARAYLRRGNRTVLFLRPQGGR